MKHKQDIYKKPKIPMKEILTRMTISVFLLGFISFEISAYFKKIPTLDTLELPTVTFDSENLAQESLMKMPQSELKTVAKNDVDQEDMRLEQQESQENESTEKENVEKNSSQSANSSSVIEIDAEQAKEKEKTLIKMMRANDDPHQLFGTVSLMQKILKENDAYKTQELVFGYEYFSPEDKAAILTKEIKANHPTTVTKLLDEGFLLIQPYDKANQLIFKRQYKMAILLLKRKIIPATAKNRFGYTLLHEAAAKGHATLIRLLVSLGADINAQANDGASALHYPSHLGFNIAVSTLIDLGIDLNMKATLKYPGLHWNGYTPLHVAAHRGKFDVVEKLLKAGANIDAIDNQGYTALDLATKKRYSKVVKLLQEHLDMTSDAQSSENNTTVSTDSNDNEADEDLDS